jgi:hypothetical protein
MGDMCMICIDFERGALKPTEARRALREMRESLPAEHVKELERKLDSSEHKSTAPPKP